MADQAEAQMKRFDPVLTFPLWLFLLPFLFEPVEGQTLESKVEIQVQAALKAIEEWGGTTNILFDPRIAESQDSVVILARRRLEEMGISTHTAYGVPDTTVSLLNLQGFAEIQEGTRASASLLGFHGRREEMPVPVIFSWRNTYEYLVTCDGDQCVLREDWIGLEHADNMTRLECLDTYFAPQEEKPERCRWPRVKRGPPTEETLGEPQQILNQTVDSLPHFISKIWGYEEHKPYTIVLNENLLAQRAFEGLVLSVEKHDQAFIADQQAKPFVLGICSADRLVSDACSPGNATMAVGLDKPVIERDSATVQVRIVRPRNPEGPERRSGFFAEFSVHFIRSPDGWKYTEYRLGSIT